MTYTGCADEEFYCPCINSSCDEMKQLFRELSELRAKNSILMGALSNHMQKGCKCSFCVDAKKLVENIKGE